MPYLLRGLKFLFIALTLSFIVGCGTMRESTSANADRERIQALERELRRRQSEINDLKERNLVLERRLRNEGANEGATAPDSSERSQAAPAAPASEPTGDQLLYSKILQTYRARNLNEMEKSLGLLMKTYPESVYADNALYLCGQLAFEIGDLNRARRYMDQVLNHYPKGNKAVGAMFAKAIIEKKLSRPKEAKYLLEQLRERFPGSPEALRVATELKLLEMSKTQKRGM